MSSTEPDVFYVNDSVHGFIELSGKALCYIIDTPEFQRLRKIKQLGGACYVYPGATHTRFDHSIGVCFIASELINHLKKDKCVEKIVKKYKKNNVDYEKCVKVAALCHDLGHGPYSHLYDFAVKDICRTDKLMEHEYRSKKILNQILSKATVSKHGVSSEEKKVIGDMITFSKGCKDLREKFLERKENWEDSTCISTKKKDEADYYNAVLKKLSFHPKGDALFFYEIVANGFTEIDVDKMDYFIRDGHGLGLSSFFDWRRYIQTLKVCKVTLDRKRVFYRLCSRDKEALELYQLFHIRNQLFRQAYRHKTTIAVEHMLKKAMKKAHPSLVIARGKVSHHFLEAWKKMPFFFHLNDSFEDIIMEDLKELDSADIRLNKQPQYYLKIKGKKRGIGANENDTAVMVNRKPSNKLPNKFKEAREIICNIRSRKLIKFIDKWRLKKIESKEKRYWEKRYWKEKEKEIKRKSKGVLKKELPNDIYKKIEKKEMIIVEQAEFHYGMKQKNPIEEHYFYKKVFPGERIPEAHHLSKDEVSKMLPEHFLEKSLMVYWDFHELSKIKTLSDEECKKYQKKIPKLISKELKKIRDDDN